ncbi:MAG: hypothetical protein QNJ71_04890 [Acidimicrobiia bacterium]|nr:hypothetical protein [Acidimicrobiia bacterium]
MTDDHLRDEQTPSSPESDEDVDPGWPWSFLLLVFAGGAYLIFRFVEIIAGLF